MTDSEPICFLVGVTAAGKTELALRVAEATGAAILSMDSMLVYRRMDVGTAKPDASARARAPHYLIDLADPDERYDLQRYTADFQRAEADAALAGRRVLVTGGTGLYLQSIVYGVFGGPPTDLALRERLQARAKESGSPALHRSLETLDPEAAARIHPNDEKRVLRALEVWEQTGRRISEWQAEWRSGQAGRERRIVGVRRDEPELTDRILRRTRAMLDAGWVEEARAIRDGAGFGPTAIQALGYREVLELADGDASRQETEEQITLRTRQFARRQRTWFRRFPEILWIDPDSEDAPGVVIDAFSWPGSLPGRVSGS